MTTRIKLQHSKSRRPPSTGDGPTKMPGLKQGAHRCPYRSCPADNFCLYRGFSGALRFQRPPAAQGFAEVSVTLFFLGREVLEGVRR